MQTLQQHDIRTNEFMRSFSFPFISSSGGDDFSRHIPPSIRPTTSLFARMNSCAPVSQSLLLLLIAFPFAIFNYKFSIMSL